MLQQLEYKESLQTIWHGIADKLENQSPFYTPEWHDVWRKTIGKDWQAIVLVLNNAVIAPLARKEGTLILSGGYEVSDYIDIVGPEKEKPKAWREILNYARQEGIRLLELRNIPETSETLQFFQNPDIQKNLHRVIIEREDTTPRLYLPDTWEGYLNSLERKDRHELERKIRKFEREHQHIRIDASACAVTDIDTVFRLMRLNTQKSDFLSSEMEGFFRLLTNAFHHEMEIMKLFVGDEVVAATLFFEMGTTVYLYNSGFDEQKAPGSGLYLKAMNIKHAIECGRKSYNFLQGNERYKYELGGKDFFVYKINAIL